MLSSDVDACGSRALGWPGFHCTPGEPGECYLEHSDPISDCGNDEVGHSELRLGVLCRRPVDPWCLFYVVFMVRTCDGWIRGVPTAFPKECLCVCLLGRGPC